MNTTHTSRIAAAVLSVCMTTVLFGSVAVLFSTPDADAGLRIAGKSPVIVANASMPVRR